MAKYLNVLEPSYDKVSHAQYGRAPFRSMIVHNKFAFAISQAAFLNTLRGLQVSCPTCGVPAHHWCEKPNGYKSSWIHVERFDRACSRGWYAKEVFLKIPDPDNL